ncbi:hypothetical protein Tco_0698974 [Tanacetum coccineum]
MLWAAQKVSSQPTETASQVAGGVLVFARDEPAGSDGQPGGWLVPEKEILKFLRKQGSGILDWFKHEGEVVYTTSLRMVCEVFCKHEKNIC